MSTNVHAEVRGKYARAPMLNARPFSCKNNAPQTFFKEKSLEETQPIRHKSILERRRRLRKRQNSIDETDPEIVDQDIKELTRLLKIERLKRLIVQKRLEVQEN